MKIATKTPAMNLFFCSKMTDCVIARGKSLCFESVFLFKWQYCHFCIKLKASVKESVSMHLLDLFLISGNVLIEKYIFFLFQAKYI